MLYCRQLLAPRAQKCCTVVNFWARALQTGSANAQLTTKPSRQRARRPQLSTKPSKQQPRKPQPEPNPPPPHHRGRGGRTPNPNPPTTTSTPQGGTRRTPPPPPHRGGGDSHAPTHPHPGPPQVTRWHETLTLFLARNRGVVPPPATGGDFENMSLFVIFVGGCPRWFLMFLVFRCFSSFVWVATPGDFEHMS